MSSLAMKRVVATALAGAALTSAIGTTAVASPTVPPPPSSIAASAGEAYEELRAPDQPAVPPPPSSLAASADRAYQALRMPDQDAVQPIPEPWPVADEPSGFDLPSAAIGAASGAGLVLALLGAGGLGRRRPVLTR